MLLPANYAVCSQSLVDPIRRRCNFALRREWRHSRIESPEYSIGDWRRSLGSAHSFTRRMFQLRQLWMNALETSLLDSRMPVTREGSRERHLAHPPLGLAHGRWDCAFLSQGR